MIPRLTGVVIGMIVYAFMANAKSSQFVAPGPISIVIILLLLLSGCLIVRGKFQ